VRRSLERENARGKDRRIGVEEGNEVGFDNRSFRRNFDVVVVVASNRVVEGNHRLDDVVAAGSNLVEEGIHHVVAVVADHILLVLGVEDIRLLAAADHNRLVVGYNPADHLLRRRCRNLVLTLLGDVVMCMKVVGFVDVRQMEGWRGRSSL
jgi:hypothetical protein